MLGATSAIYCLGFIHFIGPICQLLLRWYGHLILLNLFPNRPPQAIFLGPNSEEPSSFHCHVRPHVEGPARRLDTPYQFYDLLEGDQ
jgi:hypothetical protein